MGKTQNVQPFSAAALGTTMQIIVVLLTATGTIRITVTTTTVFGSPKTFSSMPKELIFKDVIYGAKSPEFFPVLDTIPTK